MIDQNIKNVYENGMYSIRQIQENTCNYKKLNELFL